MRAASSRCLPLQLGFDRREDRLLGVLPCTESGPASARRARARRRQRTARSLHRAPPDRRAARVVRSRRRARPPAGRPRLSRSRGSRRRALDDRGKFSRPTTGWTRRPRETAAAPARGPCAEEGDAAVESGSRARRSRAARSGPSPATVSTTSGTATSASSAVPRAFCGPRRPAKTSAFPSSPNSARSSSREGSAGSPERVPEHGDPPGTRPQRSATTQVRAGQKTCLALQCRVARRTQERVRAALDALELVERPAVASAPRRAARRPRRTRASRRADDAAATRSKRDGSCSSRTRRRHDAPSCARATKPARDEVASGAPPSAPGTGTRRAPPLLSSRLPDGVPLVGEEVRERGRVARRATESGGQMPETTTTLTAAATSPSPVPQHAPRRADAG